MLDPGVDGIVGRPVSVAIVVPVFCGERTLPTLVQEVAVLRSGATTPSGRSFVLEELVLVWDHGPDRSDDVLRELESEHGWIQVVWLSRNFGQHAATVAGMAATGADWVVTMDEDGQHDPAQIGVLLDKAYEHRSRMVYAAPSNRPPHGVLRNLASRLAKTVFLRILSNGTLAPFHSYRLIAGDAARAVAAYAGPGVYLDVALSWVVADVVAVPVTMRGEGRDSGNYRFRSLLSHFWRLVLSSGNRPLRLVSGFGVLCAVAGALYSVWQIVERLRGVMEVPGWTSVVSFTLIIGGLILISLGVIAEYVGMAASMSMGRPNYVALDDPARRFGRPRTP